MFEQNKYYKWYLNIVYSNTKRAGKLEKHHIIPKSMGGNNSKSNIVELTPKEHYICHLLLTKAVINEHKSKMIKAAYLMGKSRNINSKSYSILKEKFYESCKGPKNWSKNGKERLSNFAKARTGSKNSFYGKSHTHESKEKMRKKMIGKLPSNIKSVTANGKIYCSVSECSRQNNISPATVIYRIKSKKYSYFYTAIEK